MSAHDIRMALLALDFDEPSPLPEVAPGELLDATSTPVVYELEISDQLAALIAVPGVCIRCTAAAYVDVLGLCSTCRALPVASA